MSKHHHDYATAVAHVELMAALPRSGPLRPTPSFESLSDALESQHYGLARVKRRVLEYLAVRALGGAARGVVLCFAGASRHRKDVARALDRVRAGTQARTGPARRRARRGG